jgi:hypothetical protein
MKKIYILCVFSAIYLPPLIADMFRNSRTFESTSALRTPSQAAQAFDRRSRQAFNR